MTIYLDSDYKCRLDSGIMAIETDYFDGKCQTYIEGYRLIPEGETWTREDGVMFRGLMIAPWRPYAELEKAQLEYELAQLKAENADMLSALEVLGVIADE